MPSLRTGRASKACDSCRKNKTRCYASGKIKGTCLRCETLSLECSLKEDLAGNALLDHVEQATTAAASSSHAAVVDARLDRLEALADKLVNRLESILDNVASVTQEHHRRTPPLSENGSGATSHYPGPRERHPAPVFLIRDACTDAGVRSPEHNEAGESQDVISTGLVPLPTAHSLLRIFHVYYGRWVKFSEDLSSEALLPQVRHSPLLLCSLFLIAVRHTTDQLADQLAPRLFQEAKRLLSASLLTVPQGIEFYQSIVILSLWSTTIGQVPLSVDSWMITGYALQQAMASPFFIDAFQCTTAAPVTKAHCDAWCLWTHLTLAHLHINGYLYSKRELSTLSTAVDQPRSQFLQMGFHFAHLFAYYQSLRSAQTGMDIATLSEMIRLSETTIKLAINTADERTRHLTDHIYHLITFSALTLCQVIHNYEPQLTTAGYDLYVLDSLIYTLINWFGSIGLRCHVAHILGDIISAQFQKLRPGFRPSSIPPTYNLIGNEAVLPLFDEQPPHRPSIAFTYPNVIGLDLFSVNDDTMPWPQCV
ncbi:Zn(2)-C6 fungal-type DNA-binding domain protein [Metarhizium robertsii ARSEF 23]|uniref:Transcriptional activator of proteases prtT n=1 Tax=Metarhizium robertsii (strain ARSEF 23 / ATCC MYA-3075) TaxID=655844 RepID=E9FBT8_METRA|nr:Zn(2)-C6 fungal-type DNA-binding domain protein [Metarhizium robertsii ARSEF 23]EFY94804.2 Zn(2)-C6 fungal-type DNA-binding domain protein [Metarhizium robertsii ARSEF 23]